MTPRAPRLLWLACVALALPTAGAASVTLPTAGVDARPEPGAVVGEPGPLTLGEVLASTSAHFPLLRAAFAERDARREELRSAAGAFDLRLGAVGDLRPVGFYESYTGGATVEQQTRLWGSRFYTGYRYGTGDFGSYDGDQLTDEGGEVRVGLEVPLLRGGRIDAFRADLSQAEIGLRRATPEIRIEQIAAERSASIAFWEWVATGRRVAIAERLLEVAETRQEQLAGRAARGVEPRINLVDNRRLIVERQQILRGAERDFAQAAIRLSLYLRDDDGDPIRPPAERLPSSFPGEWAIDAARVEDELAFARENHPLLEQFALDRERLSVERDLARNELLPGFDLKLEGSRDFGSSEAGIDERGKLSRSPRGDTEVKALLTIEFPVQQRRARGRLGAALARLTKLEGRERLARERVVAEALQAVEELEAAYVQTGQARENLELAEQLRAAEARKLELGLTNLIDLNIREVQAATAARQLVDAQHAYFRAWADYTARIAGPQGALVAQDARRTR